MTDSHAVIGSTLKLIELTNNSALLDGLAAGAVAQVSSTLSLSALQGDFQMSRMQLAGMLTNGPKLDGVGDLDKLLWLVLARGEATVANVSTALAVAQNADLTPAGGTIFGEQKARERNIILMLPFKFVGNAVDVANAETISRYEVHYEGGPLGKSLAAGRDHSYVFPKNFGWRWHVLNSGNSLDDDTNLSLYIRYTGRFLDD